MSDHLGETIEPLSLAEKGRTLSGQLPLRGLDRLCQSLQDEKGVVDVSLHFDKDEVGQPRVMGRLAAVLQLQCQRCMQVMEMPVSVDVRLGIVRTQKQAESLPGNYDPLLVSEQPMTAADIVEDELILALPLVALHEMKSCPAAEALAERDEQDEVVPQRKNPFAVLAELKKERND
ncbi:MAG TPA: metal-binding protein [Gammaproteobacteria bacterium]|nr:metal-binding protein [Gammaproteobacteria bacterium]